MARHFTLRCTQGLTVPCGFEMAAKHTPTLQNENKKSDNIIAASIHPPRLIACIIFFYSNQQQVHFRARHRTTAHTSNTHGSSHYMKTEDEAPKTHVTHFVSCLQLERAPKDAQEYKFPKMYICSRLSNNVGM
jgi:hypothetical protein